MRRGLTLLELLVALALVLALAALTLPPMLGRLEQQTFDAAADTAEQHLLLARAYAQSTGRSVEVRYHADPPRLEAIHFDPSYEESSFVQIVRERAESPLLDGGPEALDDERAIPEGWAEQPLPDRIRIDPRSPADTASDDELPLAGAVAAGLAAPAVAEPLLLDDAGLQRTVRLVVYLPDGSALAERPFYLLDDRGRAAKIAVNPWTGLCTIERMERASELAAAATADKQPEEEPLADEEDLLTPSESPRDDPTRVEGRDDGSASDEGPQDQPAEGPEEPESDDGGDPAADEPEKDEPA